MCCPLRRGLIDPLKEVLKRERNYFEFVKYSREFQGSEGMTLLSGQLKAHAGQVVGLLGGSFDPAHAGHAHITREALKRFNLDAVWWLVSPGNPLKEHGPAPMQDRMEIARKVMDHPKVHISDYEQRAGTRYTAQTLKSLMKTYPKVRFVWLMGADNLVEFHRWQDWRWIMENVPIGVLARPGDRVAARTSKAAKTYGFARLRGRESWRLGRCTAPAWCFVNVAMVDISSTKIRAARD